MDANEVLRVGFDSHGFWQEANSALAQGTREMLLNARDKAGLVAAYDRMDESLGEIVARHRPPESARAELSNKLGHRISLVARIMHTQGIDANSYWDAEMKSAAMLVLKSLGLTKKKVVRIDDVVGDAIKALCKGNFTQQGASKLLAEISTFECTSVRALVGSLGESPGHMDFLGLLSQKGTAKAKAAARQAMCNMMPKVELPRAKVLMLPMMAQPRQPLRHG